VQGVARDAAPGVLLHGEDAGEDAGHVAVEDGQRYAVGEGEHGRHGIVADAGEGAGGGLVRGEPAAVVASDLLRGAVEVPGTRVVAESLPRLQDVVERRLRQRLDGRERFDEPLEVRPRLLDARLLEHDLREPDAVRIAAAVGARLAPGERPAALLEPGDQGAPDVLDVPRLDAVEEAPGEGGALRHGSAALDVDAEDERLRRPPGPADFERGEEDAPVTTARLPQERAVHEPAQRRALDEAVGRLAAPVRRRQGNEE